MRYGTKMRNYPGLFIMALMLVLCKIYTAPEIVQAPPTLSQEREEIFDFIEGQKAKSTVQKTNRDIQRFKRYLAEKKEHRNPEDLDPKVMAILFVCLWS